MWKTWYGFGSNKPFQIKNDVKKENEIMTKIKEKKIPKIAWA